MELKFIEQLRRDLAEELREQPEMNTQFHLLRFLHARANNYPKALLMLKNCLAFRKTKDLSRIAKIDLNSERMRTFRDYYTAGHYGFDFEGRLIIVERVGSYDYKGMARDFSLTELEDYIVQLQERILFIELPLLSELFQKRVDRCLVILDLKNLELSSLFKSKFQRFISTAMRITSDYYPELMGKSVFVNAPFGTQATWSLIKLGLDAKTAEKFEICNNNGRKYLSKLLDFDQLPIEIGGKNAVSLQHGYGPYMDEVKKSWAAHRLVLADREPEYRWFYTPEERQQVAKEQTKSTMYTSLGEMAQSGKGGSGIMQSSVNQSSINKSSINSSKLSRSLVISKVRVNSYFTLRPEFK